MSESSTPRQCTATKFDRDRAELHELQSHYECAGIVSSSPSSKCGRLVVRLEALAEDERGESHGQMYGKDPDEHLSLIRHSLELASAMMHRIAEASSRTRLILRTRVTS